MVGVEFTKKLIDKKIKEVTGDLSITTAYMPTIAHLSSNEHARAIMEDVSEVSIDKGLQIGTLLRFAVGVRPNNPNFIDKMLEAKRSLAILVSCGAIDKISKDGPEHYAINTSGSDSYRIYKSLIDEFQTNGFKSEAEARKLIYECLSDKLGDK